jgi:hypothetical protein
LNDLRDGIAPSRQSCSTSASVVSLSSRLRRRLAAAVARRSSMVFESHTVHVISEASASPIITAFTTMSALRNMPHGDKLRGNSAVSIAAKLVAGSETAHSAASAQALRRRRNFTFINVGCIVYLTEDDAVCAAFFGREFVCASPRR